MEKPGGITATVVLLAVGGLACLGMAALMFVVYFMMENIGGTRMPQMPVAFRVFPIALFGGLGAWVLVTAVGVWKLRNWGRLSLIAFSALMVIMQGLSALMMFFIPFPPADPRTDQIMHVARILLVVFYLVQVAIGVWWLIYFNRNSIKLLYLGDVIQSDRSARPLSIVVIAWHLVVFGLMSLPMATTGWPTMLFGVVVQGWWAISAYLAFGAVSFFLGYALLKLHPRAVDWTIAYLCFLILHASVFWFVGDPEAAMREILAEMQMPSMPQAQAIPAMPMWLSLGISLATFAVPLWYLVTRRDAYLAASRAKAAEGASAKGSPPLL